MMRFLIFLVMVTFPIYSGATLFSIQPLPVQLGEADVVIIGDYIKKSSIELENGMVATQYIFKIDKEYGVHSTTLGIDEVIIHFPGGSIKDKIVHVDGVPRLIPGEKVAIMAKNVDNRYWGLNLGLGTYKVVKYGGNPYLVNSLFPEDREIGQISQDKFERAVEKVKGQGLVTGMQYQGTSETDSESVMALKSAKNSRTPASANESSLPEEKARLSVWWLCLALGLGGGIYQLLIRREKKLK